jgi:peptide/nickel transport system permease protein
VAASITSGGANVRGGTRGKPIVHAILEVARRPAGFVGLAIVVGLCLTAILAPLLAPSDPISQDIAHRLAPPSLAHPLGTDELGRDLLSRMIFGARVALSVALPAVPTALAIGLGLGLVAGYLGGKVDQALLVLLDTVQTFPTILMALAILTLLGPSRVNVIIVIIVGFSPGYARITRALVFAAKQQVYVEAERSLGASTPRILLVHLLPNIVPPLVILLAMDLPIAITIEAGLSFLGLGALPPTPSWGSILSDGFQRVRTDPWPVLWPSVALVVITIGFTMLGERLRDVLDPALPALPRWRRP